METATILNFALIWAWKPSGFWNLHRFECGIGHRLEFCTNFSMETATILIFALFVSMCDLIVFHIQPPSWSFALILYDFQSLVFSHTVSCLRTRLLKPDKTRQILWIVWFKEFLKILWADYNQLYRIFAITEKEKQKEKKKKS